MYKRFKMILLIILLFVSGLCGVKNAIYSTKLFSERSIAFKNKNRTVLTDGTQFTVTENEYLYFNHFPKFTVCDVKPTNTNREKEKLSLFYEDNIVDVQDITICNGYSFRFNKPISLGINKILSTHNSSSKYDLIMEYDISDNIVLPWIPFVKFIFCMILFIICACFFVRTINTDAE